LTTRPDISVKAVRGSLLYFGIASIVAGILTLIWGVCTIGSFESALGWAGRLDTMNLLVPIGFILLAAGMSCLAYAYVSSIGYASGVLLCVLAAVIWAIRFVRPSGLFELRASYILQGSMLLVAMAVTFYAVKEISLKVGPTMLMLIGYYFVLVFGVLGGVGYLAIASLNADAVRAGVWSAGGGAILGGVAGLLLSLTFLRTSGRKQEVLSTTKAKRR